MVIKKKIWTDWFDKVASGEKKLDLRIADFKIKPGDTLVLEEWDEKEKKYTGRKVALNVTYVLKTKDCEMFYKKEDIDKYGYQVIQIEKQNFDNVVYAPLVAGVVIKKDNKYLLVQEKKPQCYGQWNLPAGKMEIGDTIEQTAIKEAKEETGFDVKLLRKIGIFHHPNRAVKYAFEGEIMSGKIKYPKDEILDVK